MPRTANKNIFEIRPVDATAHLQSFEYGHNFLVRPLENNFNIQFCSAAQGLSGDHKTFAAYQVLKTL